MQLTVVMAWLILGFEPGFHVPYTGLWVELGVPLVVFAIMVGASVLAHLQGAAPSGRWALVALVAVIVALLLHAWMSWIILAWEFGPSDY